MSDLNNTEFTKEQKEKFSIADLETANWAFRKISAIEQKQHEINRLARDEIERITKWQDRELDGLEDNKEFLEYLLTEYYKSEKEKDKKFKLSTPYGKLTSRKGSKKWNIPNPARVIEQLRQRGFDELVKVKEDISLAEIKKTFTVVGDKVVDSNGELIDGVYITQNPTSYKVKVTD